MPLPSLLAAARSLIDLTVNQTGEAYYRALARGLAESLGFKFGMVGHQLPENPRKMRMRAVWGGEGYLPCFDYDLEGTPCDQVLEEGFCHFPCEVAQRFPRDHQLTELKIESYAGSRISPGQNRQGGIVIAMHDQPTHYVPEELATALDFLALRTAAEFEHERVQAKLRESEARYRGIIENCLEGVWTLDVAGKTSFVNAQMAQMLGYTPEEMQGRALFDFMDAAAQREATSNLQRRKEGIREHHEFRLKRKDGTDLWTIMATSPVLGEKGEYEGALALVSDLTERRRLEAGVLQAQKLESLGVLAGGIAHDFNNLLVGILGNSSLVLANLPPESPDRSTLEDIQTAGLRLADLTRQMLAYSGRGRFVTQRMSLNQVIEEIAQLLGSAISKRAHLRFELAPSPLEVEGDATQLRQIVMNLITNASDALGTKDGVITLATAPVHADRAYLDANFPEGRLAEGDYVLLEVSDTGQGMDAATREKIFDPFFTTKFTGRGLGLAAVQGILRSHRGAVRVDSEPGQGASFKVLLPRAAPLVAQVGDDALQTPPPLRGSGVVLVADDEQSVRKVAVRVLSEAGFEVLEAHDGRSAVELIDREWERLSAVLLDLNMPGLSGEQVLAHLRQVAPSIRVVLTSGYTEHGSSGKRAASSFLQKPWTPVELAAAFRVALGS